MVRTALAAVAERPVGRVFAALAARRGGEAVHRDGVVLTGTLTVTGQRCGVPLLDRPGSYAVVVRLSWGLFRTRRSGGHPPDVAGLALRVLDADGRGGDQDLLVDGSLPPPHDRVLVPRRTLEGWYGTPTRHRAPDGRLLNVAVRLLPGARRLTLLVHDGTRPLGTATAVLEAAAGNPPVPRIGLDRLAGGLEPVGFWVELRRRVYARSRDADPRPVTPTGRSATSPRTR